MVLMLIGKREKNKRIEKLSNISSILEKIFEK